MVGGDRVDVDSALAVFTKWGVLKHHRKPSAKLLEREWDVYLLFAYGASASAALPLLRREPATHPAVHGE